jgi:hypothetical protein
MKIYTQEPIFPFNKGDKGDLKELDKKSNPELYPLSQRERN